MDVIKDFDERSNIFTAKLWVFAVFIATILIWFAIGFGAGAIGFPKALSTNILMWGLAVFNLGIAFLAYKRLINAVAI